MDGGTYDANGNRASYSDNAAPPVSLIYNIDPASNRLLGISGSWAGSFTYDAAGNMLSYSTPFAGYSFSYDARNRQTQAYVGAIGTRWLINGLGQRITQINVRISEFYYVYDEAGHLAGKYYGRGNPVWETAWLGDLPVAALTPPAGRFYIAPDHLGSPHQITAAGGALAWLWNSDPFGNGDALGGPYDLRFPGQYFDQATKLHYNMARDYDPRLGRYLESDPIGLEGGINTYAYVGGNPLSKTDPDGTGSGPADCAQALADLARTTARVTGRVADIIANGSNPDKGHRKALSQAVNDLQDDLRKVVKNCACVAGAAAAIAAAAAAIEAAAPFLLVGVIL